MTTIKNVCIMKFGLEGRNGRKTFISDTPLPIELQMVYNFSHHRTCGVAKYFRMIDDNLYADLHFDGILRAGSYDTATIAGSGHMNQEDEFIDELTQISIIPTPHAIPSLDNNVLLARNDFANTRFSNQIIGYNVDRVMVDEATFIGGPYDEAPMPTNRGNPFERTWETEDPRAEEERPMPAREYTLNMETQATVGLPRAVTATTTAY